MHNQPTSPERIVFLDGMRALAALWVMYGHAHLLSYGWDAHRHLATLPLNLLLYMHLGVNVFLVLSGFCLALPVVRNHSRLRTGLPGFFKARALRILPPYFATLLLILLVNSVAPVVAWGRLPTGMTPDIPANVLAVNFLLLQDIFPHLNVINGPFWSIATEWHLYFIFPLLAWLLRRHGAGVMLGACTVVAVALTWIGKSQPVIVDAIQMTVPQPPYFLLLFAMGIAAAWFVQGDGWRERAKLHGAALLWVGSGMAVGLVALLWHFRIRDAATAFRFMENVHLVDPLTGAVTAVLIVYLFRARSDLPLRRLLELPILTGIGAYSYSLYLLHIPVLAVCARAIDIYLPQRTVHAAFILLATLGAGLACMAAARFARVFETGRWRQPFAKIPAQGERIAALEARIQLLMEEVEHLKAAMPAQGKAPIQGQG